MTATTMNKPREERPTQTQVDEQLAEIREVLQEKQRTLADARNANATLGEKVKNLQILLEKKEGDIKFLKSLCYNNDITITSLEGQIKGKADEQRRVYEIDNPLVQVNRKDLRDSPPMGYTDWAGTNAKDRCRYLDL